MDWLFGRGLRAFDALKSLFHLQARMNLYFRGKRMLEQKKGYRMRQPFFQHFREMLCVYFKHSNFFNLKVFNVC